MPDAPPLLLDVQGHVALITFNRPDRGNALSLEMRTMLQAAWQQVKDDSSIRVAVLTGVGQRHFCTGADVDALSGDAAVDAPLGESVRLTSLQNTVWKPVICAVNGMAAGGGLAFVVDADITVASRNATFFDTHANIGHVGAVGNIGLARRLPFGTAARMTYQGKSYRLSAERAYCLGFVEEVVESDQLLDTALALASDIAKNSPAAISTSKQALWQAEDLPYHQALEFGWLLTRKHWAHPDAQEGPRAFSERRDPIWAD